MCFENVPVELDVFNCIMCYLPKTGFLFQSITVQFLITLSYNSHIFEFKQVLLKQFRIHTILINLNKTGIAL